MLPLLLRSRPPSTRILGLRCISDRRFVPPPPSSLPSPHPRTYPRARRHGRRAVQALGVLATLYLADRYLYYETFFRNIRTVSTAVLITLDYKLNFTEHKSGAQLSRLHERTAERLLHLCLTNGGLYQKIGQALAMQTAVLPPQFADKFSRFFDETPQAPYPLVRRLLEEEFGARFPGEGDIVDRIFEPGSFEKRAVGSASVAQVHKARLRTGEEVAVKIQKPWIQTQVGMDLAVFRTVMSVFSERLFALPLTFLTPYISERLYSETDFLNEAHNAQRTAQFIQEEPSLRGRCYVPKIYEELTTRRVMTAEWIDGVSVAEKEVLTSPYRDDDSVGHPLYTPRHITAQKGPIRRALPPPPSSSSSSTTSSTPRRRIYGLGLSPRDIMSTMIDLFCAQTFLFGWLHCDPHPGNILIRRLRSGAPQLVLLDHGLYITTTPEFRMQYARFWKALLTFDNATIAAIADAWGIGNADLFASATLLRPYQGGTREIATLVGGRERGGPATAYEAHRLMREKMQAFLHDQEKMPKELVFIGRNMRIVQANNQNLGAPVNRIKVVANWASRSLTRSFRQTGLRRTWTERMRAWWHHVVFRTVLLVIDLGFWAARARQALLGGRGFEEELEERMRRVARDELGVDLQGDGVFVG